MLKIKLWVNQHIKFTRRTKDLQITITLPWFRRKRKLTAEHRMAISNGLMLSATKHKDAGRPLLDGEK